MFQIKGKHRYGRNSNSIPVISNQIEEEKEAEKKNKMKIAKFVNMSMSKLNGER